MPTALLGPGIHENHGINDDKEKRDEQGYKGQREMTPGAFRVHGKITFPKRGPAAFM
jgi:hypothetical protein